MSFDAHGNRRDADTWSDAALAPGVPANTTRGFTGHEHIDAANIVHMNGRLYDPALGRMLSADPIVQELFNAQNLNRYTYVLNNPLSFTDPTGLSFFRKYWRTIVSVALTAFVPALAPAAWSNLAVAAATGFVSGVVTSGTLKGGLFGAFSAVLFHGIGLGFNTHETSVLAHGVGGGIMAELQGGKFGSGFASAGVFQVLSPLMAPVASDGGSNDFNPRRVIAAAVVGGTASAASGGKFANGAVTGAFSFAFGATADSLSRGQNKAFVPREGDTATGKYGLFPEFAGDPVNEAVYELAVTGNRRSSNGREQHSFGGVDAQGNLVFQPIRGGRGAKITTSLVTEMAGAFSVSYPGGTILYSFHTHGSDFARPGAFENFSRGDRSFFKRNPIVGRVTGFVSTPQGLLLMHNPATGVTEQIGRVPAVRRPLGR